MLLVFGFFSLLILVDGKHKHSSKCNIRFDSDCQVRRTKWFYIRTKGVCSQKLTCRNGFDYRTDCERKCYNPSKKNNDYSVKLLEDIFNIVESYQKNRSAQKHRTTKHDFTTRKRTTAPVTTSFITKHLDTTKATEKTETLLDSISVDIKVEDATVSTNPELIESTNSVPTSPSSTTPTTTKKAKYVAKHVDPPKRKKKKSIWKG